MTTTTQRVSPRTLFRTFSFGEAVTWALLLSALGARALGVDAIVVTIAGSIHGAMFLAYATTAALVGVNQRWRPGRIVLGVGFAIVPFATVPFELVTDRKGMLAGAWRTEASEHPGDANWFDRLFRWFIARPWLLLGTLVVVVAVIYLVLISLGSPTEWGR